MEADPSTFALGDVIDERLFRDRRPPVRRKIELDEEFVARERCVIDAFGAGDVLDGEIVLGGESVQVNFRRVDKSLMIATGVLGKREHAEFRGMRPRRTCRGHVD